MGHSENRESMDNIAATEFNVPVENEDGIVTSVLMKVYILISLRRLKPSFLNTTAG